MWHVLHTFGNPVPFSYTPVFPPLALLDEGHVGVSIFMTLSGYLFARIIEGRQIIYWKFLFNRVLRLAPLFAAVALANLILVLMAGQSGWRYVKQILLVGFIRPTWPNGGWSIAVEMHFYILLPALLAFMRNTPASAAALTIAVAILLRTGIWLVTGSVQDAAYFTIIGRIDQFTAGMAMGLLYPSMKGKHFRAALAAITLIMAYWAFDAAGGFQDLMGRGRPSPVALWIFWPTLEGITLSVVIAWYDQTQLSGSSKLSRAIAQIGVASYSIYLLHFYAMPHFGPLLARLYQPELIDFALATILFSLFVPVGLISYYGFERHFLRLRLPYVVRSPARIDSPTEPFDSSKTLR
jgi:rhamnosyltransferase